MKALLIYSSLTGKKSIVKYISYIKETLTKKFSVLDIIETTNYDELKEQCLIACKEYDYLLFVGGDGAVNSVINIIANEDRKPIIGYIPGGTINDFGHNFKLSKNIKKAVNNIVNGVPTYFDVCKANDRYFTYVLASGCFSEIAYTTKRNYKKKLGKLAYYMIAIKDALIPKNIKGTLTIDDLSYSVKTPFLLVLNGNHVGGFYVNLKNNINDGKFTIFITRPGIFNGLLHYAIFKIRTKKIVTDHFTFTFKNKIEQWCVDGEQANLGKVECKCIKDFAQIIVPKKVANKLKRLNNN